MHQRRRWRGRSRRHSAAAFTVAVVGLAAALVGGAAPASAAEVLPNPVNSVTVTGPGSIPLAQVQVFNQLEIHADYEIFGGTAQVGDTFTMTIPAPFSVPHQSFALTPTGGGPSIGSCEIPASVLGQPTLMTCTLGPGFDPNALATGELFFTAVAAAEAAPPLVFELNGGTSVTATLPGNGGIDPPPGLNPPSAPPTVATKEGGLTSDAALFWAVRIPADTLPADNADGNVVLTDTIINATLRDGSMRIYKVPGNDYRGGSNVAATYYASMGYLLTDTGYALSPVTTGPDGSNTFDITLFSPSHTAPSMDPDNPGTLYLLIYGSDNPGVAGEGLTITNRVEGLTTGTLQHLIIQNAGGTGGQDEPHAVLTKQVCATYDEDAQPTCSRTSDEGWVSSATIPFGADALWRLTVTNDGNSVLTNVRLAGDGLSGGTGFAEAGVGPDPSGTFSFNTLAIGESYSILRTTTGVVETTTMITNTAQAAGLPADNNGVPTSTIEVVTNEDSASVVTLAPPVPAYAIGDYVWFDANRNGVQDADESPIGGVTVVLTDADGNPVTDIDGAPVGATTTNADGFYWFDNLRAGQYVITFTAPEGYTFTTQEAGSDRAVDSNADITTGRSAVIDLGEGNPNLVGREDPSLPGYAAGLSAGFIDPTIDAGFVVIALPPPPTPPVEPGVDPVEPDGELALTGTVAATWAAPAGLIALLIGASLLRIARRRQAGRA